MMLKIDMHTHIIPKNLPDWQKKFGYDGFIQLDHHKKGWARMMMGQKFFREINENCWDPEVRINEYKKFNTKVQVVCTIPVLFAYFAKPKDGLEVSMFLNDDVANLVNNYPKNYIGLGTIPMQSPELAVRELERIKKIGLKGIQIGSNIDDKNLVPGLRLFSKDRSLALSAWFSCLEPIKLTVRKNQLILEASEDDKWLVTDLPEKDANILSTKFLDNKKNSFGYQFISIQSTPYIEKFAGFWILRDVELIS